MRDVHVVHHEYRPGRPYGCTQIRWLRPLTHPRLAGIVRLTHGIGDPPATADLVIVERLPTGGDDTLLASAERLLRVSSSQGTPLLYTTDDNLLDLHRDEPWETFPSEEARAAVRLLVRNADGVLVSTDVLRERFATLNSRIAVLPNAIDERLFGPPQPLLPRGQPFTLGYMGTFTHMQDLRLVLRPLRAFLKQNEKAVRLEIVGVGAHAEIRDLFGELPVRWRNPGPSGDYETFPGWMRRSLHWDAAIAPLEDNAFTRCKSDVKYLDYGAFGIPGVFSDVLPYRGTIRHRETGLLVRNDPDAWALAIEEIFADEPLRIRVAEAARDDVHARRTLDTKSMLWLEAIESILPGFFSSSGRRRPAWTATR